MNNGVHLFYHMTLFSAVYIKVCFYAVIDVIGLFIVINFRHVASGLMFPVIIQTKILNVFTIFF